jgi:hypothetical protein
VFACAHCNICCVSDYPRLRNGQEAPVLIDEIAIELGGNNEDGEPAYRANFRDIAARGLANLTLTAVKWVHEIALFENCALITTAHIKAREHFYILHALL